MNVSTDPIRLAFDQYIDQVRRDEPAALATAALAEHVRNWIAHHPLQCDSYELLAELKENPGRYGPPETRAMLIALEPGPGAFGPRKIAFFLFVETLAAIAAVERTSLGAPAARRLRARSWTADTNSVWERWLELSWQQPGGNGAGSPGPGNFRDRITHAIAALLDSDADADPLSLMLTAPQRAQPGEQAEPGTGRRAQSGRSQQPSPRCRPNPPGSPQPIVQSWRPASGAGTTRVRASAHSLRLLAGAMASSTGS